MNISKIRFSFSALFACLVSVALFTACASDSASSAADAAKEKVAAAANTVSNTANAAADAAKAAAAPVVPAGPTTTIKFEETEFDFGTVDQGEKVTHVYKFSNTGNEPLIISNAKGSCGCTVPSWPKEPIPVGGSGEIQVQFDSKGKKNKQSKKVTLTANTDPAQTFLTIKGEVNAPEAAAAANK
jgi:hypothetical protein